MPGDDPKEARQRALTFLRLAETSAYPPARERYAKLAYTWLRLATELENGRKRAVRQTRLAAELENGQDLLDGLNESEPIKRTG
jgi:hypothetical protein